MYTFVCMGSFFLFFFIRGFWSWIVCGPHKRAQRGVERREPPFTIITNPQPRDTSWINYVHSLHCGSVMYFYEEMRESRWVGHDARSFTELIWIICRHVWVHCATINFHPSEIQIEGVGYFLFLMISDEQVQASYDQDDIILIAAHCPWIQIHFLLV